MRIATFATSVWLTLLGTMVLAQSVTYDYDRAANFSNYKTYAWTRGTELVDELNHARVVRAIDAAVVTKGLARVEPGANPDVLVAYHASFDRNLEITGSTHGWGPLGLGGDRWGSARVQPILVGTLGRRHLLLHGYARLLWRSPRAAVDLRPNDKPEALIRERERSVLKPRSAKNVQRIIRRAVASSAQSFGIDPTALARPERLSSESIRVDGTGQSRPDVSERIGNAVRRIALVAP